MKTCPNCKKEIPDQDWNCPYCHFHVGTTIKGTGHSTLGTFKDENSNRSLISNEDKSMLKDGNSALDDGDDYDY